MKFEHAIVISVREKKETKPNKETTGDKQTANGTRCPQCEIDELIKQDKKSRKNKTDYIIKQSEKLIGDAK